jgi:hypothetical protein
MARYDFECSEGHVAEHTFDIGTAPSKVECTCGLPAKRKFATGTSFLINKVMSAPSKRLKPGHINR